MRRVAIYRLSAQVISRSAGRSAVAAAAYRAGEELACEKTGNVHDYTRKSGVEHTEIMAPENAPEWARDRAHLWNRVEAVEKRKDSQLAREVQLALPRELSRAERIELTREFVRDQFVSRGMVADVAIHEPKTSAGETQPHAHILLTTREIGPDGFGKKARAWNATETLEGWREAWASHANRALEQAGHETRIDHRSLKAQHAEAEQIANDNSRPEPERRLAEVRAIELDREPQPKLGAAADMERRGLQTDRGDQLRTVLAENAQRRTLLEQIRDWGRQVKERALDLAGRVVDQVKHLTPNQREALDTARQYQDGAKAAREAWDRIVHEAASRGIAPQQHPDVGKFNAIAFERDRVAAMLMREPERYAPHMPGADWVRIEAHADAHTDRHTQQRLQQSRARAEAARDRADLAKMERAVYDRIREQRQRQAAREQRSLEEMAQGRDPVAAFQALSQLQRQAQEQGQKQRAEDIQKQMQQRAQDIQRTGQMDRLRQQDAQAAQQAQQMAQTRTQTQGRGWR